MTGRQSGATLAALVLAVAACPPVSGAGPVVAGRDRVRVLVPPATHVEPYANAGYRLQRLDDAWEVEVVASPLGSRFPFSSGGPQRGVVGDLAQRITAGAATRYEAVSRVLAWVARNVRYDLDRHASQTPLAVLERRTAYCTGVARLTVALLDSVGIESREVPGWVAGEGTSASYHRWVEVFYPDRGWVFSDPLRSHHYVPATYVRLAGEALDGQGGAELGGRIVARDRRLDPVDLAPWAVEGVGVRVNEARRYGAAVQVEVPGAHDGWSRLEGGGTRRDLRLADGSASFVGLEPGRYDLRVWTADGVRYRRGLVLRGAERRVFHPSPSQATDGPGRSPGPGEPPRARPMTGGEGDRGDP